MNDPRTPGYWCECTVTTTATGLVYATTSAAFSPHQAVRWMSASLRTVTPALEDEPATQARQWLHHDHPQAAAELSQGHPYTLTQHTTAITWTARPVLFLQLRSATTRHHRPTE